MIFPKETMRILLVDDHEKTADGLANLIRRRIEGEVKVVYKGDDAIRTALEFEPDVVVLDIDLPVLNGFEVLEELKKREIDTRVIMLSGAYTEAEHIVRCIRAGACDFLKKPVNVDAIIESVERHFLLENADNLRLYAEAPSLIKQLIDRTDYEERRIRSAEVDKLMDRTIKAERELGELRIAKIESDAAKKRLEISIASAKTVVSPRVELVQDKSNTWWNKISPNERAAYIGLIGVCMAGLSTFVVAVYNKSTSSSKPAPAPANLSSAMSAAMSSTGPLAASSITSTPSLPHKDLGLSLEQYQDKLDSFGGRLGVRSDYVKSVSGSRLSWQGVVESAGIVQAEFASVGICSESNPGHYGIIMSFFSHPGEALLERVHTRQTGDLVRISGYLDTKRGTGIEAEDLEIIRLADKRTP